MLIKTDSEVSSLSQSSPARSPHRPGYFVQSPSRDSSNDGEKTTNSLQSSPLQSPVGSPPHSHSNSSLGPHSRESASTRFSGARKSNASNRKGSNWRPLKDQFNAIEEEGLLDPNDASQHGFQRRCYFLAFVVGFFMLFAVFSLILWGASRPQKPAITVKVLINYAFHWDLNRLSNQVKVDMDWDLLIFFRLILRFVSFSFPKAMMEWLMEKVIKKRHW